MKTTVWLAIPASLVIAALIWSGGSQAAEEKKTIVPPPLPFDPFGVPESPKANNKACLECHETYAKEAFVDVHAKSNVGCVKCHGPSTDHRDDDDNKTPPDEIFGPANMEKLCSKCHDDHDVPAADVITRWQERCPEKKQAETILCTDCHGRHRLKTRTVRWDKKTRELITSKDVPAEKPAADLTSKKSQEPTAGLVSP